MSKVISLFNKAKFSNDETHMPVSMEQFETLTNEILVEFNKIAAPNFLSGDYMAQILMSALHAYDHKQGYVRKSDLFESCVNRVSCHVTYHAVEEIRKRLGVTSQSTEDGEIATPTETTGPTEVAQETTSALQ